MATTTSAARVRLDFASLDHSAKKSSPRLDPPGFALAASSSSSRSSASAAKASAAAAADTDHETNLRNLKIKKAWDVALGPLKSIPMNAIMLYMSGNGIQIFSILVTVMLFWNSAKAILGLAQAFEKFSVRSPSDQTSSAARAGSGAGLIASTLRDPLFLPKVAFVVAQLLNMALGVWKCSAMGLLPTSHSDWLAFVEPKK
ncbi:hypothetical protein HK405_015436, partial [Cladochytrium tenue]